MSAHLEKRYFWSQSQMKWYSFKIQSFKSWYLIKISISLPFLQVLTTKIWQQRAIFFVLAKFLKMVNFFCQCQVVCIFSFLSDKCSFSCVWTSVDLETRISLNLNVFRKTWAISSFKLLIPPITRRTFD